MLVTKMIEILIMTWTVWARKTREKFGQTANRRQMIILFIHSFNLFTGFARLESPRIEYMNQNQNQNQISLSRNRTTKYNSMSLGHRYVYSGNSSNYSSTCVLNVRGPKQARKRK